MLGIRLKELRINSGLKQDDLLKKFSLSSARYSQYETGKRSPDYETLIKFADFYNVSVDYLLGRDKSTSMPAKEEVSQEDMEILRQIKKLPADKREIIDTVIKVSEKASDEQAATSGK
jgi:transcriptional regulator with XRE-family HTH domain